MKEKEKKKRKDIYQENKKTSKNQALPKKSNPRDKYLGSPLCKTLPIILKMNEEGTSIVDDDAQSFASERWHRLCAKRRAEEEEGLS